jgi:hypothetical protein
MAEGKFPANTPLDASALVLKMASGMGGHNALVALRRAIEM